MKKWLTYSLIWIAALTLLFEEWLWERLSQLLSWFGQLPVLNQIEQWMSRLPPYAALACFALPFATLLPVNLLATYWIAHGWVNLGLTILIAAKLLGTAVLARIFTLTKPQLLSIDWFAKLYTRFTLFKQRLYGQLKATPAWQRLQVIKQRFHDWRSSLSDSVNPFESLWRRARRIARVWRQRTKSTAKN